jgi:hypothetical protein
MVSLSVYRAHVHRGVLRVARGIIVIWRAAHRPRTPPEDAHKRSRVILELELRAVKTSQPRALIACVAAPGITVNANGVNARDTYDDARRATSCHRFLGDEEEPAAVKCAVHVPRKNEEVSRVEVKGRWQPQLVCEEPRRIRLTAWPYMSQRCILDRDCSPAQVSEAACAVAPLAQPVIVENTCLEIGARSSSRGLRAELPVETAGLMWSRMWSARSALRLNSKTLVVTGTSAAESAAVIVERSKAPAGGGSARGATSPVPRGRQRRACWRW